MNVPDTVDEVRLEARLVSATEDYYPHPNKCSGRHCNPLGVFRTNLKRQEHPDFRFVWVHSMQCVTCVFILITALSVHLGTDVKLASVLWCPACQMWCLCNTTFSWKYYCIAWKHGKHLWHHMVMCTVAEEMKPVKTEFAFCLLYNMEPLLQCEIMMYVTSKGI